MRFRGASFIALRRRRVNETFDAKAEGYVATLQYDTTSYRLPTFDNAVNSLAAVLELALSQLTLIGQHEHVIPSLVTVPAELPPMLLRFNVVEVLLP